MHYRSEDDAYQSSPSTADVVLTSKHHEGWCNFRNSYHWNWNSIDVGPMRDLVGDLTASVRAAGLHMGLYHSLREWYNPLYIMDNDDNCSTTAFVDEVLIPTLKQMVEEYQVSSARGVFLHCLLSHLLVLYPSGRTVGVGCVCIAYLVLLIVFENYGDLFLRTFPMGHCA